MAVLKYKGPDGQYVTLTNYTVQPLTPVQTTGTSATDIMSQAATTNALNEKADKSTSLNGYGISDAYTKTQVDTELNKKADKSTTLSGYGITDAKILNGTITLGGNSITPITAETHSNAGYLKESAATNTYLSKTDASNTYATKTSVSAATSLTDFMTGSNTVTSLSNIPITKRLVIANVSGGQSFNLSGNTLANGREIHIIINNNSSSDITISFPTSSIYKRTADNVEIKSGSFGEINVISDGSTIYIRAI